MSRSRNKRDRRCARETKPERMTGILNTVRGGPAPEAAPQNSTAGVG
jgi:hypothetical protein